MCIINQNMQSFIAVSRQSPMSDEDVFIMAQGSCIRSQGNGRHRGQAQECHREPLRFPLDSYQICKSTTMRSSIERK